MKSGGGKQKGASFERAVCKQLSLWISQGKRQDLYWRSAMSGGRATVGRKTGTDLNHQAGDICAVHPEGHVLTNSLYFECKHLKRFTLDHLITGSNASPLTAIWKTTCKEAFHYMRIPVLIAKQNLMPVLLITTSRGLDQLNIPDEAIRIHAYLPRGGKTPSLYICPFALVLQSPPPKGK
jgi:hypothetical protein